MDRGEQVPLSDNPSKIHPNVATTAKKPSVTQIFEDKIIERAPAKLIDYKEGFILLAYHGKIIYLDVRPHHVQAIDNKDHSPRVCQVSL